jgi:hypothetical protein
MINGIPVKIKVETESGDDCETVYFASFRKCPKLAETVRRIAAVELEVKKTERLRQLADMRLAEADSPEAVDEAAQAISDANAKCLDAQDSLTASMDSFLVEGFLAAGYDRENAERIAASIPMGRMTEIVARARTGSGFCDFFSEPDQNGGK